LLFLLYLPRTFASDQRLVFTLIAATPLSTPGTSTYAQTCTRADAYLHLKLETNSVKSFHSSFILRIFKSKCLLLQSPPRPSTAPPVVPRLHDQRRPQELPPRRLSQQQMAQPTVPTPTCRHTPSWHQGLQTGSARWRRTSRSLSARGTSRLPSPLAAVELQRLATQPSVKPTNHTTTMY
jgi:hypothetical protein